MSSRRSASLLPSPTKGRPAAVIRLRRRCRSNHNQNEKNKPLDLAKRWYLYQNDLAHKQNPFVDENVRRKQRLNLTNYFMTETRLMSKID